jgi:hypothetical protein
MEVEADAAAVVSANRTTATRLIDQDPLDLLMPAGHGLADAPFTAPSEAFLSGPIAMKHHEAVTSAAPNLSDGAVSRWSATVVQERDRR